MVHRDMNGHDIAAGDFVVYSALWSRSAVLKYGIVTRLEERKRPYDDGPGEPTLRVISADRESVWMLGEFTGYQWVLQRDGKETTLGYLDRTIRVPRGLVPYAIVRLLEDGLEEWKKRSK